MNGVDTAWVLMCSALVLLMTPGVAFFYGGLVRRKNIVSTIMYSFVSIGLVGIVWVLWGYSLAFGPDIGGFVGNLELFGLNGVSADAAAGDTRGQTFMIFQAMFAIITPALVTGAFAERMKFSALCLFIVLWVTIVYAPLAHWVWGELQETVSRNLVSKAGMEQLLGSSGISNDTTVILYGDNNNWFAAWAFWQMKYYGHDDVKLMNGGRAKWLADGNPLTTDVTKPSVKTYIAVAPNEDIRAYRDQILGKLSAGTMSLVDVRAPAEYSGELLAPENLPQEGSQRGGHIPSAANIPWAQAVAEDGTFKSADELRAIYSAQGIDGGKEIISYCRIGERSSHTWFVLTQLLGHSNVRNYDGSWTEWGSIVGAPIEK